MNNDDFLIHLCPRRRRKTHLRHLRGPHPQGAAGGELPFAGRGTGQGDAGRPRRRQRLPLPALQRGQRHRPAPPLPAPPGRRHRSGDGGAGHGPARAARRKELRESPADRGRKAGRPCHHRRTELQSPPHQRRSGRGRKSPLRKGLHPRHPLRQD